MRPAQISLTTYFVRDLEFKLNEAFEPLTTWGTSLEDFDVTAKATPKTEDRRNWEVTLRLAFNPPPERNSPCTFVIEVTGSIQVDASVKDENVERFVNINGVSLVFGATREIVRLITSYGVSKPILIPTVTFWEPKPAPAESSPVKVAETEVESSAGDRA